MDTTVCNEEIVDYAYPTMMAERYTRELHSYALKHEFDKARDCAMKAIQSLWNAQKSLEVMEQKSRKWK